MKRTINIIFLIFILSYSQFTLLYSFSKDKDFLAPTSRIGISEHPEAILKSLLISIPHDQPIKFAFVGAKDTGVIAEMALTLGYLAKKNNLSNLEVQSYSSGRSHFEGIDRTISEKFLTMAQDDPDMAREFIENFYSRSLPSFEVLDSLSVIVVESEFVKAALSSSYPTLASKIVVYMDFAPGVLFRDEVDASQIITHIFEKVVRPVVDEKTAREFTLKQRDRALRTLKLATQTASPKIFFQNLEEKDIQDETKLNQLLALWNTLATQDNKKFVINIESDRAREALLQGIRSQFPTLENKITITTFRQENVPPGMTFKEKVFQDAGISLPDKQKVCFVCTGNTCRSPMAYGYFEHIIQLLGLADNFEVMSRGTSAGIDERAHFNAREVARILGFNIDSHQSRQLSESDKDGNPYFFALTESHKRSLVQLGVPADQIRVMNVPDPFNQPLEVYLKAFGSMEGFIDEEIITDSLIQESQIVDLDAFDLINPDQLSFISQQLSVTQAKGSHKTILLDQVTLPITEVTAEISLYTNWNLKWDKQENIEKPDEVLRILKNAIDVILKTDPWVYGIDPTKLKIKLIKGDRLGNLIHNSDGDGATIEINIYTILKDIEAGRIDKPLATLEALRDEIGHFKVEHMFGEQENPVVEEALVTLMRILDPDDEKLEESWIDRSLDQRVQKILRKGKLPVVLEEKPVEKAPAKPVQKLKQKGEVEAVFEHPEPVKEAIYSSDGNSMITISGNTAYIYEKDETGAWKKEPVLKIEHQDEVNHAEFSPDGKSVVTASRDKTALIYEKDAKGAWKKDLVLMIQHQNTINHASFSPDGKSVVTASHDGTALIYEKDENGVWKTEPVFKIQHQSWVLHAAFSPDGRSVVTASFDTTALIHERDETGTWKQESVLTIQHDNRVIHAAFSPDGRSVVTASADETAMIHEKDESGAWKTEPVLTIQHKSWVTLAAFSPDGKSVVTASHDSTALIHEKDESGSWKKEAVLKIEHKGVVLHAAFSPDGKSVVTASLDNIVLIHEKDETGTWKQESVLTIQHQYSVNHAAFSPDGRSVVTASLDRTARITRIVEEDAKAVEDDLDLDKSDEAESQDVKLNAQFDIEAIRQKNAMVEILHSSAWTQQADYQGQSQSVEDAFQKRVEQALMILKNLPIPENFPPQQKSALQKMKEHLFGPKGIKIKAHFYTGGSGKISIQTLTNMDPAEIDFKFRHLNSVAEMDVSNIVNALFLSAFQGVVQLTYPNYITNWNPQLTSPWPYFWQDGQDGLTMADLKNLVCYSTNQSIGVRESVYIRAMNLSFRGDSPDIALAYLKETDAMDGQAAIVSPEEVQEFLGYLQNDRFSERNLAVKLLNNAMSHVPSTAQLSKQIRDLYLTHNSRDMLDVLKERKAILETYATQTVKKAPSKITLAQLIKQLKNVGQKELAKAKLDSVLQIILEHIRESYSQDPRYKAYQDAFQIQDIDEIKAQIIAQLESGAMDLKAMNDLIELYKPLMDQVQASGNVSIVQMIGLGVQSPLVFQMIELAHQTFVQRMKSIGLEFDHNEKLWRGIGDWDSMILDFRPDGFYLGNQGGGYNWSIRKSGTSWKLLASQEAVISGERKIDATLSEDIKWDLKQDAAGNYYLVLSEETPFSGTQLKINNQKTLTVLSQKEFFNKMLGSQKEYVALDRSYNFGNFHQGNLVAFRNRVFMTGKVPQQSMGKAEFYLLPQPSSTPSKNAYAFVDLHLDSLDKKQSGGLKFSPIVKALFLNGLESVNIPVQEMLQKNVSGGSFRIFKRNDLYRISPSPGLEFFVNNQRITDVFQINAGDMIYIKLPHEQYDNHFIFYPVSAESQNGFSFSDPNQPDIKEVQRQDVKKMPVPMAFQDFVAKGRVYYKNGGYEAPYIHVSDSIDISIGRSTPNNILFASNNAAYESFRSYAPLSQNNFAMNYNNEKEFRIGYGSKNAVIKNAEFYDIEYDMEKNTLIFKASDDVLRGLREAGIPLVGLSENGLSYRFVTLEGEDAISLESMNGVFQDMVDALKVELPSQEFINILHSFKGRYGDDVYRSGVKNVQLASQILTPAQYQQLLQGNALFLKAILYTHSDTAQDLIQMIQEILSDASLGQVISNYNKNAVAFKEAYYKIFEIKKNLSRLKINLDKWKSPLIKRIYTAMIVEGVSVNFPSDSEFDKLDQLLQEKSEYPLIDFFESNEFIGQAISSRQYPAVMAYIRERLTNVLPDYQVHPRAKEIFSTLMAIPAQIPIRLTTHFFSFYQGAWNGDDQSRFMQLVEATEMVVSVEGIGFDLEDSEMVTLFGLIHAGMTSQVIKTGPQSFDFVKTCHDYLGVFQNLSQQLGHKDAFEFIQAIGLENVIRTKYVRKKHAYHDKELQAGKNSVTFNVPEIFTDIMGESYKDQGVVWEYVCDHPEYVPPSNEKRAQVHAYFKPFQAFNENNNRTLSLLANENMTIADYQEFIEEMEALVYHYLVFLAPNDNVRKMPRTLSLEEILKTQKDFYKPIVLIAEKFLALKGEIEMMLREQGLPLERANPAALLPDPIRKKIKELDEKNIQFSTLGKKYVDSSSLNPIQTLHEMINLLHQDIISKSRDVLKSVAYDANIARKPAFITGYVASGKPHEKNIELVDIRENADLGKVPVVASLLTNVFALEANVHANPEGKTDSLELIADEYDAWGYLKLGVHSAEIYVNSRPPDRGGGISIHYSEGAPSIAHRRRARLLSIVLNRLGFEVKLSPDEINVDAKFNKDTGAQNLNEVLDKAQMILRLLMETRNLDWDLGASVEGLDSSVYRDYVWKTINPKYEKTPREKIFLEAMADQVLANGYLFTQFVSSSKGARQWDGTSPYQDAFTKRMKVVSDSIKDRINERLKALGLEEMSEGEVLGQRFFNRVQRDLMKAIQDGYVYKGPDGTYQHKDESELDDLNPNMKLTLELLKNISQREDYIRSGAILEKVESMFAFEEVGAVGGYTLQVTTIETIHHTNIHVLVLRETKTKAIHMAIPISGRRAELQNVLVSSQFQTEMIRSGYITHETLIKDNAVLNSRVWEILQEYPKREPNLSSTYKDGLSTAIGIGSGQIIIKRHGLTVDDVKGKILIAETLEPEDDPLIAVASGIITTKGGILSHASVRAREFGKPSIIVKDGVFSNGNFIFTAQSGDIQFGNTVMQGETIAYHTVSQVSDVKISMDQDYLVAMDADRGRLFVVGKDDEVKRAHQYLQSKDYKNLESLILDSQNETLLKYLALEAMQNPDLDANKIFKAISLRPHAEQVKAYIASVKDAKVYNVNRTIREIFYRLQSISTPSEILYLLAALAKEVQMLEKIQGLLETYHIDFSRTNYTWVLDKVSAMLMEKSFSIKDEVAQHPVIQRFIGQDLESLTVSDLDEARKAESLLSHLLYLEPDDPLALLKAQLSARVEAITREKIDGITASAQGKTVIWKAEMDIDYRHVVGGKSANSAQFNKLGGVQAQRGFGTTVEAYNETKGIDWEQVPKRQREVIESYWKMVNEQRLKLMELVKSDKTLQDDDKSEIIDILEDEVFQEEISELALKEMNTAIKTILKNLNRSLRRIQAPYQIQEALQRFASVAARSSGIKEDSVEESYAGQNLTKLNVVGPIALLQAIQEVWMDGAQGVLVEEMLNSQISGVAFSANVSTGNTDQVIINAAYGLGEGVVNGTVDPDKIVVDKKTGVYAEAPVIGTKEKKVVFNPEGGTRTMDVESSQSNKLCLTTEQIQKLKDVVIRIEEYFGYPVDVEWAIDQYGNLVILQVRPITTLRKRINEGRAVFDKLVPEVRNMVIYRQKTEALIKATRQLGIVQDDITRQSALRADIREKTADIVQFANHAMETNLKYVSSIYLPPSLGRREYFLVAEIEGQYYAVYKNNAGDKLILVNVENPDQRKEYAVKDSTLLESQGVRLFIPKDMALRRKEIESMGLDDFDFLKDPVADHRELLQSRIDEIKALAKDKIGFKEFMDFYAAYAVDGKISSPMSKEIVAATIQPAKEYLARQALLGSMQRLKRIAVRIVHSQSDEESYEGRPVYEHAVFQKNHVRLSELLRKISDIKLPNRVVADQEQEFYRSMAELVPDAETLEFIYTELVSDDILEIYPRGKNNFLWLAIARGIRFVEQVTSDHDLVRAIDTLKNSVHNTGQEFVHYMPEAERLIQFFDFTRSDSEETIKFLIQNASIPFQGLLKSIRGNEVKLDSSHTEVMLEIAA